MRRRNTTRKGPTATKRPRNKLHTYETVEPTMPGMNGQSVRPQDVDKMLEPYEAGAWIDTYISGTPVSYTIVNIPAELLVPWQMNQRRAEEMVNQMVATGKKPRMRIDRSKKAVVTGMKEESIALIREYDLVPLIRGMLDNMGPLDPCDVIVRKDGFFDVAEGSRRVAVSHFLTGFLGEDERLEKALSKKFRAEIRDELLCKSYPGMVPCRVFRNMGKDELRDLLERHHLGGKMEWQAFVQAKSAFESFEAAIGKRFTLRNPSDLNTLRKELSNKDHIGKLKSIASRCQLANYCRIRYRIMAFAAQMVFKVQYVQPAGLRAKYDTFRRFYEEGRLRSVAEGGELIVKQQSGNMLHTGYVNKHFESDFIKWVADGRIHDTIQVSELPWILAYEEIREDLFLKGDPSKPDFFKKCVDAVDRIRNGSAARLLDNLDSIYDMIDKASKVNVTELGELTGESKKIKRLKTRVESLCKRLEAVK